MANPQIQEVIDTMWWKLVPWILLCSFIGTFAGLAVKWMERRATRFGQDWRKRKSGDQRSDVGDDSVETPPHCPICNALMVKRTAKRGAHAGSSFWGCTNYPEFKGTRDV